MKIYIICILLIVISIIIMLYCHKNKPQLYSQLKQDEDVLKYYNNKSNGYFVDIGANDGITLSNTYLLEKDYNWNGICIEPVPSIFKKLEKNRPNMININNPLYNVDNKTVTIIDNGLLSGITEDLGKHKETVLKNSKGEYKLQTRTLTSILDEYNAPSKIEYMSLDTEGSELKILQGLDFSKYKFGYLNIEHNYEEPKRTQMRTLLESNGYTYYGANKFDDNYIYKNL